MPESQSIEYKSNWKDEYLKWIGGFANANGGKLYIGVDNNGEISGVGNHHDLMVQLPNKFRDILGVFAEVNLHEENGKHYLEVIIPRYDVPISLRGKYYVRAGSNLQELKGPSLNEFILRRTGKTWDDIIEPKASIKDIKKTSVIQFLEDAKKVKRINLEENIRLVDLLNKLRLLENGQIKRAAIVLFGNDPGKFYPNMFVKIGKFGHVDTDLKFHEVLEGNLIQLTKQIGETLNNKFFIHPIDFIGMQRVERDEYPVAAIREMILNALVHRNYLGAPSQIRVCDDHFSVWNDGGLPEGITEEDLWKVHRSKPRNPLIADICFKAGYIDAWGRGTIKIIEACKNSGLPEPVMTEEQGGFLCELSKSMEEIPEKPDDFSVKSKNPLTELREKYGRITGELRENYGRNAEEIIALMLEEPDITIPDIANKIKKSQSTVEKCIKQLREAGLVWRIGSTKSGYWKVSLETK